MEALELRLDTPRPPFEGGERGEGRGSGIEVGRPPLGIVYAPVKTLWSGWGPRSTSAGQRVFGGAYTLSAWLLGLTSDEKENRHTMPGNKHTKEAAGVSPPSKDKQTKKGDFMKKRLSLTALSVCILCSVLCTLPSCNATRTITTKSEYWQKGDTSCVIQTRTIESYDASKKL